MTTATSAPKYGQMPTWSPSRPRLRPLRLLFGWILSAAALLVAASIVPGAAVHDFRGALAAAAVIAVLNAVLPPIVAALRLPLMLLVGLVLILVLDALMLLAADSITNGALSVSSFWSALGVALVAAAVGVVLDVVLGTNDDDTYTFRVTQRIARRSGERTITDAPGVVFLEIDGLGLPVLQRAMRDGNTPTLARWVGDATHRLAEWETDLSSQTGASQSGISLGREGYGEARRVLRSAGLRRDRAASCLRARPAHGWRRQPRQPPFRRSRPRDPDRQPDGRREALEPRLSRLLRERVQRRPRARPVRLGGAARMVGSRQGEAARRPPPRPPGWALPIHAGGAMRRRPRPDRVRGPWGHDERAARDLRDLFELRRGRAPLGARAGGHTRSAAQARPAVRTDRARPRLRSPAVRDRRALRPRTDAGSDLQAAQRLRARRARRALACTGRRHERRRRRRAGLDGWERRGRGDRTEAEEAAEERRLR